MQREGRRIENRKDGVDISILSESYLSSFFCLLVQYLFILSIALDPSELLINNCQLSTTTLCP